jgi:hypothetical protein
MNASVALTAFLRYFAFRHAAQRRKKPRRSGAKDCCCSPIRGGSAYPTAVAVRKAGWRVVYTASR